MIKVDHMINMIMEYLFKYDHVPYDHMINMIMEYLFKYDHYPECHVTFAEIPILTIHFPEG